jgi:sortase (surface protein transpeptidase)
MRKTYMVTVLAAGLALGSYAAVHAKLPAPPAKSDAEKAAEAEKAAAAKAKEAELNAKAQDKAVANYRKNKGAAMDGKATASAAPAAPKAAKK